MKYYKVKVKWELIKHALATPPVLNDEVYEWLEDNKVFGWTIIYAGVDPLDLRQNYINFTNTTDAMLFQLRWS